MINKLSDRKKDILRLIQINKIWIKFYSFQEVKSSLEYLLKKEKYLKLMYKMKDLQ